MASKTILVVDATATEMAAYAVLNYGLDVNFRTGKNQIVELLKQSGFAADEITVETEDAPAAPAAANDIPGKKRRMVRLTIPSQEKSTGGGNEPVPVAVNGRLMWVPRDQECEIPHEYFLVLQNSRTKVPIVDGDKSIIGWRWVQEYPYSVHRIDPDPVADAAAYRPDARDAA